jgi:hypothetical protein
MEVTIFTVFINIALRLFPVLKPKLKPLTIEYEPLLVTPFTLGLTRIIHDDDEMIRNQCLLPKSIIKEAGLLWVETAKLRISFQNNTNKEIIVKNITIKKHPIVEDVKSTVKFIAQGVGRSIYFDFDLDDKNSVAAFINKDLGEDPIIEKSFFERGSFVKIEPKKTEVLILSFSASESNTAVRLYVYPQINGKSKKKIEYRETIKVFSKRAVANENQLIALPDGFVIGRSNPDDIF